MTMAVIMAVTIVVAINTAAFAGTKGCVTKREFAKVSLGDTRPEVHEIFGTTGRHGWETKKYIAKIYRVCGYKDTYPHDDKPWAKVTIEYRKGKGAEKIFWTEERNNIVHGNEEPCPDDSRDPETCEPIG